METEHKIFEGGTIKEVLAKMLKEGYVPLGIQAVWKLRKNNKIPLQWYTSRTIFCRGEIREATIDELENIEATYEKGGHVLYLGDNYCDSLNSDGSLYNSARFVGVKK